MSLLNQSIIEHKMELLNLADAKAQYPCQPHWGAFGLLLTETQVAALERKREEQQEIGEIETAHPGYLGSQDTFYVGNMKGVGRIYQQTFVDTYAKVAFAKLYTTKTPIAAADLLNDRVLPFYQEHEVAYI